MAFPALPAETARVEEPSALVRQVKRLGTLLVGVSAAFAVLGGDFFSLVRAVVLYVFVVCGVHKGHRRALRILSACSLVTAIFGIVALTIAGALFVNFLSCACSTTCATDVFREFQATAAAARNHSDWHAVPAAHAGTSRRVLGSPHTGPRAVPVNFDPSRQQLWPAAPARPASGLLGVVAGRVVPALLHTALPLAGLPVPRLLPGLAPPPFTPQHLGPGPDFKPPFLWQDGLVDGNEGKGGSQKPGGAATPAASPHQPAPPTGVHGKQGEVEDEEDEMDAEYARLQQQLKQGGRSATRRSLERDAERAGPVAGSQKHEQGGVDFGSSAPGDGVAEGHFVSHDDKDGSKLYKKSKAEKKGRKHDDDDDAYDDLPAFWKGIANSAANVTLADWLSGANEACANGPLAGLAGLLLGLAFISLHLAFWAAGRALARHPWMFAREAERKAQIAQRRAARALAMGGPPPFPYANVGIPGVLYTFVPGVGFMPVGPTGAPLQQPLPLAMAMPAGGEQGPTQEQAQQGAGAASSSSSSDGPPPPYATVVPVPSAPSINGAPAAAAGANGAGNNGSNSGGAGAGGGYPYANYLRVQYAGSSSSNAITPQQQQVQYQPQWQPSQQRPFGATAAAPVYGAEGSIVSELRSMVDSGVAALRGFASRSAAAVPSTRSHRQYQQVGTAADDDGASARAPQQQQQQQQQVGMAAPASGSTVAQFNPYGHAGAAAASPAGAPVHYVMAGPHVQQAGPAVLSSFVVSNGPAPQPHSEWSFYPPPPQAQQGQAPGPSSGSV